MTKTTRWMLRLATALGFTILGIQVWYEDQRITLLYQFLVQTFDGPESCHEFCDQICAPRPAESCQEWGPNEAPACACGKLP